MDPVAFGSLTVLVLLSTHTRCEPCETLSPAHASESHPVIVFVFVSFCIYNSQYNVQFTSIRDCFFDYAISGQGAFGAAPEAARMHC